MDILADIIGITERNRDHVFLIDSLRRKSFSFHDVFIRAGNLARALKTRGVGRGDRIGAFLPNSPEFAFLYFACLYSGVVLVPVNGQLSPKERSYILMTTNVRLILFSCVTFPLVSSTEVPEGTKMVCLESLFPEDAPMHEFPDVITAEEWNASSDDWVPFQGVQPEDGLSIHFTSGTTSRPKGVQHSIWSLLGNARKFNRTFHLEADNRFLHNFSMSYTGGVLNTLFCPFLAGGSVVMGLPFDAKGILNFWKPIIEYEVNSAWFSPTMLTALTRVDKNPRGIAYCRTNMKKILVCTAPLACRTKVEFEEKYGVEVFESYGLSELLLLSANTEDAPRKRGSVGRLLPDVELKIVADEGDEVAAEAEGEIIIRTPYAFSGYLRSGGSPGDDGSEASRSVENQDGWFATGDLGYQDREGNLFITGRKKDLIIRGGFNVSPRAVEEVILSRPGIDQVAVVGLPHEFYGEEVVAAVVFKPGFTFEAEKRNLEKACREELNQHSIPTRFFALSDFPVNQTGKVQKNLLRQQLMALMESRDSGNAPVKGQ